MSTTEQVINILREAGAPSELIAELTDYSKMLSKETDIFTTEVALSFNNAVKRMVNLEVGRTDAVVGLCGILASAISAELHMLLEEKDPAADAMVRIALSNLVHLVRGVHERLRERGPESATK